MRLHQLNSRLGDPVSQRLMRPIGDPGFFGHILGGIGAGLKGAIGFATGGIGGGVRAIQTEIQKHPKIAAGAAAGGGLALGGIGAVIANKLKKHGINVGGAAGGNGGRRRYRRINPMNYRALKRATRRIHQAKKIYSTVFHQAKQTHVPKRLPKGLRSGHRRRAAA